MANSVDPDQTAPIGAVCSGSTLSASILNSSVMFQQTSADNISKCGSRGGWGGTGCPDPLENHKLYGFP